MTAYEVFVNGEKICLAGVGERGLLNLGLSWSGRNALDTFPASLRIGGLVDGEHINWSPSKLFPGDEMSVHIVRTETVDEPLRREKSRTRFEEEAEVCGYIEVARSFLATSPIQDEHEACIELYEARLQEKFWQGAIKALAALGEINQVPAQFWEELGRAAARFSDYESASNFQAKARQMEAQSVVEAPIETTITQDAPDFKLAAFEVFVNNARLCLVGIGQGGVLSLMLTYSNLQKSSCAELHVGGLINKEHVSWITDKNELSVGDTLKVRVLIAYTVDEPLSRSRSQSNEEKEEQVRQYLETTHLLLPSPLVESETASDALVNDCLSRNFLSGAMDTLGALGELNTVPAQFWRQLRYAAHILSMYDDRNRYAKKEWEV